ncbi:kinase-like domain-containing protein, partial [Entophlyctis helioformis]
KVIGKGGFGKVCIVERKQDRALFALKYTEKEKASKDRALHYILQERNILEDVHHPYICAMRYSFQDSKFLYMVLDLMEGGDLRFHLKNMKRVPENTTLFIVSEISSALEYLHSLNIVHRDIKPDNILLDKSGHAHLSDFNVAVQYIVGKPLKSIAGTEPCKCRATMAPEMLNGQGYFGAVDWWSLGVTMFELIYGERPFRSKHRRELIKKGKWRFPPDAKDVSEACMLALTDFLRLDPSRRLGYGYAGSGLDSLRVHPFFGKMDWDGLASRLAATP